MSHCRKILFYLSPPQCPTFLIHKTILLVSLAHLPLVLELYSIPFNTYCYQDRASYSFIAIAPLVSLGILEGFFHVWWVHSRNKAKKYLFVNFACFGVVNVAWFRLVEPEVYKNGRFGSKKIAMLDRTLTTPIIYFELLIIFMSPEHWIISAKAITLKLGITFLYSIIICEYVNIIR